MNSISEEKTHGGMGIMKELKYIAHLYDDCNGSESVLQCDNNT